MQKIPHQNQYILAIDTSCDDTSAAVVEVNDGAELGEVRKATKKTASFQTILSNVVASQTQLHKQYGGVFPTVAKLAHKENIGPVVKAALRRAGVDECELAAVAATEGPGLAPALEVGIKYAREMAVVHQLPLIAVNHIEGHILSVLAKPKPKKTSAKKQADLGNTTKLRPASLPALALIISGGHTEFVLVNQLGRYQILGQTLDDAAGECLDKIGRMLNLGYPAGPTIEKFAKLGNPLAFEFPLPLTQLKNYDLSFSGLKTFARNKLEEITSEKQLDRQDICDFSASIQYAVFRHIIYKLNKVLETFEVREIWLGGGVAANIQLRKLIRKLLTEKHKDKSIFFRTPYSKKLCMDNGAMIGVAAAFKLMRGDVVASPTSLDRKPRLSIASTNN